MITFRVQKTRDVKVLSNTKRPLQVIQWLVGITVIIVQQIRPAGGIGEGGGGGGGRGGGGGWVDVYYPNNNSRTCADPYTHCHASHHNDNLN